MVLFSHWRELDTEWMSANATIEYFGGKKPKIQYFSRKFDGFSENF